MNRFLFAAIPLSIAFTAGAQQHQAITAQDYARAETRLGYNTEPLIQRNGIHPNWLADDRFYYRTSEAEGGKYYVLNPANGKKSPVFDQEKLAAALSEATGNSSVAGNLPIMKILSIDANGVIFTAEGKQ